ncbi:hypothetical protein [Burkholderia sp. BCC1972]|uniref:hypothetical protein n=1 Tax=Burkholderia sp. BCC1972 TaxID=2817438 RepID=UPI002ABD14FB|nr:hypothetical protein [Burkholderia sp. BCC1972]
MTPYDPLREHALADPEVRAEYERVNREEFVPLDAMLAARRAAGTTQADTADGSKTSATFVK